MKKSVCVLPVYKQTLTKECLNYLVCYNYVDEPETVCVECNSLFGSWRKGPNILETEDRCDCPICHNPSNKICVKRPYCKHYICVDCFRKLYFGHELDKPVFPYKGQEEEYWDKYNFGIDEVWMKEDCIIRYHSKFNNWKNWKEIINKFTFNTKCFECTNNTLGIGIKFA